MKAILGNAWWRLRLAWFRSLGRIIGRDVRQSVIRLATEAARQEYYEGFLRAFSLAGGSEGWSPAWLAWAALVYYDAGQSSEAKRLFGVALERGPNDGTVLMCYGRYIRDEGRDQESLLYLKRSLEVYPHDPWALTAIGGAYRKMGDWQEAKRCYTDALRYKPDPLSAGLIYNGLAHVEAQSKAWKEAARLWRESVRWLPRTEETWYNLGDALLHAGDCRGAIKALRKNLRLGSGQPAWTYYDLASSYQILGDRRRARRFCQKALEYAPDDEDALELMTELASK